MIIIEVFFPFFNRGRAFTKSRFHLRSILIVQSGSKSQGLIKCQKIKSFAPLILVIVDIRSQSSAKSLSCRFLNSFFFLHGAIINSNNNELYLHDHTSTYSITKAIFRNQIFIIGQLLYFDNNLSRTSKQAEIYFTNCILIK